jgi:hypothetical protein
MGDGWVGVGVAAGGVGLWLLRPLLPPLSLLLTGCVRPGSLPLRFRKSAVVVRCGSAAHCVFGYAGKTDGVPDTSAGLLART